LSESEFDGARSFPANELFTGTLDVLGFFSMSSRPPSFRSSASCRSRPDFFRPLLGGARLVVEQPTLFLLNRSPQLDPSLLPFFCVPPVFENTIRAIHPFPFLDSSGSFLIGTEEFPVLEEDLRTTLLKSVLAGPGFAVFLSFRPRFLRSAYLLSLAVFTGYMMSNRKNRACHETNFPSLFRRFSIASFASFPT